MEIRALAAGDDRSSFHSGDPDLDRFFQKYAGQNQFRHFLGVTYVALDGNRVLGYATVAPGDIEIDDMPNSMRKRLGLYPLPILRLARLAVDEPVQGQGLGGKLLHFVLRLAFRMANELGCVGVVVDAKPGAIGFYAGFGFIPLEAVEGGSETRPAPVPMFLSMRAITAAIEEA
ncbi:MAG: GNAT family N-acetyltransferase [Polyangia bacterium]|jgi:predicted N-acetyltransferase YhbS|nr:GNAT family N-acetyltransferase [Polyangia bacterium]